MQPDIVHAHNVLSAKLIQEIGDYPFIYDNHEYWSKYLLTLLKDDFINPKNSNFSFIKSRINNIIKKYSMNNWIQWELDIVSEKPTLVPSNTIAIELSHIGKKVFTVPNFPMKKEIEDIPPPQKHSTFSSVYAGVAPYVGYRTPIRNIDGFLSVFSKYDIGILNIIGWKSEYLQNIKYHGFLDRKEMFSEMTNNSIGLIPFKRHPFHYYISPNKAYEYAHAGLLVLITNTIKPIFDELKDNATGFENHDEMVNKLKYFKTKPDELFSKRQQIFEFSRKYMLWEKNENYILEAYKLA